MLEIIFIDFRNIVQGTGDWTYNIILNQYNYS